MVKIGGAPASSGWGILMVSAVFCAQLPSTRFLTACGVVSTPIALGSAVAHEGTDERLRIEYAPRPEHLKEVVAQNIGRTVFLLEHDRSKLWLIIFYRRLL
mmetsp:Transcript_19637/g.40404  ORF Transcript_19637/g.40404 Transcript_19637/m.40404 type:complete len:101 (-) Transcript_19637:66-368(-)